MVVVMVWNGLSYHRQLVFIFTRVKMRACSYLRVRQLDLGEEHQDDFWTRPQAPGIVTEPVS